jgi:hypothetical protein
MCNCVRRQGWGPASQRGLVIFGDIVPARLQIPAAGGAAHLVTRFDRPGFKAMVVSLFVLTFRSSGIGVAISIFK